MRMVSYNYITKCSACDFINLSPSCDLFRFS